MSYTYQLEIKEFHLDTFGHVNHATYLQICEEARWQICQEHGVGMEHIQKTQIGPIVLDAKIKFRKELKNRDKIKIETKFSPFRERFVLAEHIVYRPDGQISAEAELTIAIWDLRTRKLIEPPEDWAKALQL